MFTALKTFFLRPDDRLAVGVTLGGKVSLLFRLLVLDLVIALSLGGLIGLIESLDLVDMDNHAVAQALQQFTVWQIMLIAILGTPFVEELVFRLPLRYRTNPIAGLARLFTPELAPEMQEQLAAKRRATWDKYFGYTFYGLTIAFAFIHLTNYPSITLGLLLLSPLLVAPQFVMGALAGYLRVRYGFLWAFLLHALHNLILVGLAVVGVQATEIVRVENERYCLVVEEVSPLDKNENRSATFGDDSIAYHNTPLSEVIRSLEGWADSTVIQLPEQQIDPNLNVELKKLSRQQLPIRFLSDTLLAYYGLRVSPEMRGDTLLLVGRYAD